MRIPLGYSTERGQAWIGPGNVRIQAGVGIYSDYRQSSNVNVSGDLMAVVYLPGGVAGGGTLDIQPSAKVGWRPGESVLLGLELLGNISRADWGYIEWKAGIVPHVYGEYQFERLALNAKVGFGPGWSNDGDGSGFDHVANALNVSIGVSIYP
jgi:hypothetical protein